MSYGAIRIRSLPDPVLFLWAFFFFCLFVSFIKGRKKCLLLSPLAFLGSHFDRWIQREPIIFLFLAKYAEDSCSVLMSPAFEPCHHEVSPTPYVKNCRFDVCSCSSGKDCLCSAIANYAAACARKSILVQWRQPDFCRKCSAAPSNPLIFLILKEFFWQCWVKDLEWDAQISLWQMVRVNLSSTLVKDAKGVPRDCSALGERSGDLTQLHRTFTWVSIFSYSPGNFLNVPGWKSPKWFVVIHELPSFEPQVSHVLTSSVTPDFRWMWGCGGSTKKGKTNLYQKWILAVLWHHPWSQQG